MMITTDLTTVSTVAAPRALKPVLHSSATTINCGGITEPVIPARYFAVASQTPWTALTRTGPPLPSEHA